MTALAQTPLHRVRAERRPALAGASSPGQGSFVTRSPSRADRSRIWWIAAAVVVGVFGGAWWTSSHHGAQAPAGPMLGQRISDEGFEHVPMGSQIQYKVNPPVSGPHYPFPAPAGVYPNGLQTGFWLHSLEHGYIVLLYRPPASAEHLAEFDRMVKDFPKSKYGNVKLVIAPFLPLSDMPHPYAVLAWDWRLWMDSFDRATVLQFYEQHVNHGREDIR